MRFCDFRMRPKQTAQWVFVEPEVKFDETGRMKTGFADLIEVDLAVQVGVWLVEPIVLEMVIESIDFAGRAEFDFAAN